ncbi:MAG: hypothetical protein BJ554DRAFT_6532 [Olpidium bornovanus]|uniref:Uncharacterized protein n=1 Tax=Olpidium bornovanus TaxID=278681 RepID=A0A8H7ZXJ8_9FUNG|nr:MAG: hypothetical protein BJ554DRAFT_6532 [Olpidium bornovanus]
MAERTQIPILSDPAASYISAPSEREKIRRTPIRATTKCAGFFIAAQRTPRTSPRAGAPVTTKPMRRFSTPLLICGRILSAPINPPCSRRRLAAINTKNTGGRGGGTTGTLFNTLRIRSWKRKLTDRPRKAGLDGGDVVVEIVVVQAHSGLEAQTVPGCEAGHLHVRQVEHDPGQFHRVHARHGYLEAVLARVPGSRDVAVDALQRREPARHERKVREVRRRKLGHDLRGPRTYRR